MPLKSQILSKNLNCVLRSEALVHYFLIDWLVGWLVGWFINVLVNYWVISRTGPKTERLTILRAVTHETELGDHDLSLIRSHYTDFLIDIDLAIISLFDQCTPKFVYICLSDATLYQSDGATIA